MNKSKIFYRKLERFKKKYIFFPGITKNAGHPHVEVKVIRISRGQNQKKYQ